MELTPRDVEVITFLRKGFIADTQTLDDIFFHSYKPCNRRLLKLYQHQLIKRSRTNSCEPYVYYLNKMPSDFKKGLLRSKLFAVLKKSELEILDYYQNYQLASLTVDLLIIAKIGEKVTALLFSVKARGTFNHPKMKGAFQDPVLSHAICEQLNQIHPVQSIHLIACCPSVPPIHQTLEHFHYIHIHPRQLEEGVLQLINDLKERTTTLPTNVVSRSEGMPMLNQEKAKPLKEETPMSLELEMDFFDIFAKHKK